MRWLWALLFLLPIAAQAQPACTAQAPNAPACLSRAVNPVYTDIVDGQQGIGPSRANQSVQFSLLQLIQMNHTTSPVAANNGGGTQTLGVWTSYLNGTPDPNPVNFGSTFTLSGITGSTQCLHVSTLGVVSGTGVDCGAGGGGGVNSGTAGQMTWYAATGATVSGNSNVTVNLGALTLGSSGVQGSVVLNGATSGTTTLVPNSTASGTITFPAATDTVALLTATQTLTGKTISGASNTISAIGNGSLTNSSITFGGQAVALGASAGVQGNGALVQLSTGTLTSGDCLKADANGNIVDAGAACSLSGSGTVNAGTGGQLTWYATNGSAVSGNTNATISLGALTLGSSGVGGSVAFNGATSGTTTLAPTAVAGSTTITMPAATDTMALLAAAQTLTNKTISGAANTLSNIANASLTNSAMTFGGQSISLGGSATVQGNGAKVQLSTGSLTNGHCLSADSNGNVVDAGGACTTGGGGGTVASGLINQLAWYSSAGTTIAGLTTANNGVLVTSGGGVPSISTTLPSGLSATSLTLVTPALGTPASGVMTNVTGLPLTSAVTGILPSANGGTGVNNGSTLTMGGNITFSGAFTQTFTATSNTSVTLPISGTLITTSAIPSAATTAPECGSGGAGAVSTCSATMVLPNGTTATTQIANDGSTKVATTAYVATPGAITPTNVTASGQLIGMGTSTNDNACTGCIGEFQTATASSVSVSTGTAANVTSLTLTGGDWDVWGVCSFNPAGSTTVQSIGCSTSSTTATFGGLGLAQALTNTFQTGSAQALDAPVARYSISSSSPGSPVTWNPADETLISLSNANLTATSTGAHQSAFVRATTSYTTGKYCFQETASALTANWTAGIANSTYAYPTLLGSDANGIGIDPGPNPGNQAIYYNNVLLSAGSGVSANGDSIVICADLGAKKAWFSSAAMRALGQNWDNNTTDNPATATGGMSFAGLTCPCFPTFNDLDAGGVAILSTAGPFAVATPSGFVAWQTAGSPAVYLVGRAFFGVSTMTISGVINARRAR